MRGAPSLLQTGMGRYDKAEKHNLTHTGTAPTPYKLRQLAQSSEGDATSPTLALETQAIPNDQMRHGLHEANYMEYESDQVSMMRPSHCTASSVASSGRGTGIAGLPFAPLG